MFCHKISTLEWRGSWTEGNRKPITNWRCSIRIRNKVPISCLQRIWPMKRDNWLIPWSVYVSVNPKAPKEGGPKRRRRFVFLLKPIFDRNIERYNWSMMSHSFLENVVPQSGYFNRRAEHQFVCSGNLRTWQLRVGHISCHWWTFCTHHFQVFSIVTIWCQKDSQNTTSHIGSRLTNRFFLILIGPQR